jgi:hypothetical protein
MLIWRGRTRKVSQLGILRTVPKKRSSGGVANVVIRLEILRCLCEITTATERLLDVARQGRIAAVRPEVYARRGEKTRGDNLARWGWAASSQPAWLTSEFYETKIYPLLSNIPRSAISSTLGVSKTYAGEIRTGRCLPHTRHWQALAKLIGISEKHSKREQAES